MLYDLHLSQPFFGGAEQTCRAIHLLRLICAAVFRFAMRIFPRNAPSSEQGSAESANEFARLLESQGITATVRRRLGADVNAACGQLRRSNLTAKEEETK
jgi:adenine C2-methylase RlmN of 23S rRNA A2503 and tRNA A37